MTKYLAIAILITGFLVVGNAYGEEEEVFYCADIASNGFRYDHQLKEYVPARFKERKFKMKLSSLVTK
jgi:hypothetical protein|tara:strand:+ start:212 stop:415 length:204 start_codon:yes stop_codon:yes gene_type:complete